jgi:hypothetical protein
MILIGDAMLQDPLVEGDENVNYNQWMIQSKVPASAPPSSGPWRDIVDSLLPSAYSNTKMNKYAPDVSIELEWVYGYQSQRSKNNLRYTAAKGHCIVYPIGRYCVLYSFDMHKQNIFAVHRDEVLSLAMHPVCIYPFVYVLLPYHDIIIYALVIGGRVCCYWRFRATASIDCVELLQHECALCRTVIDKTY